MANHPIPPKTVLTILYDGQCPICVREIAWLQNRQPHQLAFQDVHAEAFSTATLGVSINDLLAEIHGIGADGQLIKGIDVFAIAYSSTGLKWLAAPLVWPWSRPAMMQLYSWFARYRKPLANLWWKACHNGQCRI
jgi:predicted DCC family thiol-disulfide oxidoreductase YuxK